MRWCLVIVSFRSKPASARCRLLTFKEVLDKYKFFPGLGLHWVIMGPSGRETRPDKGGVLEHYKRCNKDPAQTVKMVANTFYIAHVATHPHNFEYWCALTSYNEGI